jgi:hypothetical protein
MARVTFYDPEMDWLLKSPSGPTGRFLAAVGRDIMAKSRAQVGVKTGALKASIRMSHSRDPLGQKIIIGSKLKHAYLHHEGSVPHIIVPKQAKMLKFVSKGRMVLKDRVFHPGTKANKYLKDPMEYVVSRV